MNKNVYSTIHDARLLVSYCRFECMRSAQMGIKMKIVGDTMQRLEAYGFMVEEYKVATMLNDIVKKNGFNER